MIQLNDQRNLPWSRSLAVIRSLTEGGCEKVGQQVDGPVPNREQRTLELPPDEL